VQKKKRIWVRGADALESICGWISVALLALSALLICVNVFTVYFLNFSVAANEELSQVFFIFFVYLLIWLLTRHDQHVTVDLLPRALSTRARGYFLIISDIATICFCIILGWGSIDSVLMFKSGGGIPSTQIPIPYWVLYLCIPIGIFLMLIASIERLAQRIWSVIPHRVNEASRENQFSQ
jgi:TRAP-type C4-dicarboxylate transport system permease small subunit